MLLTNFVYWRLAAAQKHFEIQKNLKKSSSSRKTLKWFSSIKEPKKLVPAQKSFKRQDLKKKDSKFVSATAQNSKNNSPKSSNFFDQIKNSLEKKASANNLTPNKLIEEKIVPQKSINKSEKKKALALHKRINTLPNKDLAVVSRKILAKPELQINVFGCNWNLSK